MYSFDFHRPSSLVEAAGLLMGEAKILAGGHTLLPTLKQRLTNVSALVSLDRIPELVGIREEGGQMIVGAMTTHATVSGSAQMRSSIPALAELAKGIGDPQVRNRGTIGGSIANHDPAADYPAAVLALDAVVRTDQRNISADDFFKGIFSTALEDGEIIREIAFPVPERAGYAKFRQAASLYALAGVFVARTGGKVRVAVTGSGIDGVFRAAEMEDALNGNFSPASVAAVRQSESQMMDDFHGSAAYRAHLVAVMAGRAVERS